MLSVFTYANNTSQTIPDKGTLTSTISVPDSYFTADVNVTVNMTHTRDEDLDVFLIAPDGTRVELFTDVGGTGDHFTTTVLMTQLQRRSPPERPHLPARSGRKGICRSSKESKYREPGNLKSPTTPRKKTGTLNSWSIDVDFGCSRGRLPRHEFHDAGQAISLYQLLPCSDVAVSENGDAMAMWLESKGPATQVP